MTIKDFCFCTLAIGQKYCLLALELAKDLEKYAPDINFIILTDKPKAFEERINVLAFKHEPESIKFYHDKRFVIEKALSLFDTCIFLDADMRVLEPVAHNLKWLPGITARTGQNIIEHNKTKFRDYQVILKIAKKLNLELEKAKFVHEFFIVITKDNGKEIEFLKQWEMIARYFELNGIYAGEGNVIGLAAVKANLTVRFDPVDRISFFKDRIERVRINKGQSNAEDKLVYFQKQKELEFPKRSKFEILLDRIKKNFGYLTRLLRLRIVTLKNIKFYYQI